MESKEPGCVVPLVGFLAYKYVALLLLVAQTVGAILILRVSKTVGQGSVPYLNTTAVFYAELIKLVGSVALVSRELGWSVPLTIQSLKTEVWDKPAETLKVGVPALLYTVQNNLLFIALANMSPALYQVTYQLKILSTALLSVLILRRRLSLDRWLALLVLTAGVALIQLPSGGSPAAETAKGGSVIVGTIAVLCACMTSGFAGVYFEKILKGSKTSIWMRNVQLALLGCALALVGAAWNDGRQIKDQGFHQGYNWATWTAILAQSAGGLIVAAVLKFADNILKCFGNAVAIALSCLTSYFILGDYQPTYLFVIGTASVILATYVYGTESAIFSRYLRSKVKVTLADPDLEIGFKTQVIA